MPIVIKKLQTPQDQTSTVPSIKQTQVSFIKTGAAAKAKIAQHDAEAEVAREIGAKPFRFYISKANLKKDFRITFLDGDLDVAGELEAPIWDEHSIEVGGRTRQFVCLQSTDAYCPACTTDSEKAMVAAFTIIDHSPYTYSRGPKMGETVKNQRKLYICKRNSLGMLGKYATIHKGLRGLSFDVSRSTDRSARVGDVMIAVEKFSEQELMAIMGKDKDGNRLDLPYNYHEAAPYFTAEKMVEVGIGGAAQVVGSEPKQDLSGHL